MAGIGHAELTQIRGRRFLPSVEKLRSSITEIQVLSGAISTPPIRPSSNRH